MQRKRIVHVTFNMDTGGAEQVIVQLATHTDADSYDVAILCLENPVGPMGKALSKNGMRVDALNRQPGFDWRLVWQIRRYRREYRVDVFHCHQYTPFVYGFLGALGTETRVVFTEHGRFYPDLPKPKRMLVNPVFGRLVDHMTSISKATKHALVNVERFPRSRIQVVYNGIDGAPYDHDTTRSTRLPDEFHTALSGRFVVGNVARLDPIKNHRLMLNAVKEISALHPDLHLCLVGDGPEREGLEAMAKKLGIQSHVLFTGTRQDVYLFYERMDVFILTSFSEGTAMTLLEAMASGLPCIVTDVGGNPEIIEDGNTGFVIPNNDCQALVEKISLLKQQPKLRKELGRNARRKFLRHFSVQQMTHNYENIYRKL